MEPQITQKLIQIINEEIIPLAPVSCAYKSIIRQIGDCSIVLIGEATHGTEEFYQIRMEISEILIKKHGFMAIAIEGDWPDAYQVHRYLQGNSPINNATEVLNVFKRFPSWMWRNLSMVAFLQKLRTFNDSLPPQEKIGFYGLDLYSLNTSMEAVIEFLRKKDPVAAQRAINRYSCFDHVKVDPQLYGYLSALKPKKSCLDEVVTQLLEMQHHAFKYIKADGLRAEDEYFFATQNARLVKNAENYYRNLLEDHITTWNIRDTHMAETVNVIADHLQKRRNQPAKLIVWAHNSHVGDARATEMGQKGEVNLGQLLRETHDKNVYTLGFSTYQGTVTAANNWGEPPQQKRILPGSPGSYELLFHNACHQNFVLHLNQNAKLEKFLNVPHLQRAIGVIYRPETERFSHYFLTHLPLQFDSLIHIDTTNFLKPVDTKTQTHL
ncbi:erythromycin esterase (plasmid) [Legionella adelaidensis]|uniref:Erythromycin esterase n=1 Tax=Legionella adelaidensis TaxID=45056 RepID=A0A0W0R5E2_9GAMM|nr:erythromycin esterase family protein [Legionella adelaidensis]KTC66321.1 erythromycin esterase [Legionella adelaidensis]VEH84918.1 erythromycin esterase [Legionella adelaidensis]